MVWSRTCTPLSALDFSDLCGASRSCRSPGAQTIASCSQHCMAPSARGNSVHPGATSVRDQNILSGDAAIQDEPHDFALGPPSCRRPAPPLPPDCTPVHTLAEWLALEQGTLFKAARAPAGYALERRVHLGVIVHHEPTGFLVWPQIVPDAPAAQRAKYNIMFVYSSASRLRDIAVDPEEFFGVALRDTSVEVAISPHEPATFSSWEAAVQELFEECANVSEMSRDPQLVNAKRICFGCVAMWLPLDEQPVQSAVPETISQPSGGQQKHVTFAEECRRRKKKGKLWQRAAPPTPAAPRSAPCTGNTPGPFTKRLQDNGMAITRWDPKLGAWLAPVEEGTWVEPLDAENSEEQTWVDL